MAAVRSSPASSRACLVRAQSDSRRHAARYDSVAESGRLRFHRRSQHRRLRRRRQPVELPVRQSGTQRAARSGLRLERSVPHQMVPLTERAETAHRRPVLQLVQSPEFRPAVARLRRNSRQAFHPDRLRRADLHDLAADRSARRRAGRRQFSAHDRVPGAVGILMGDTETTEPLARRQRVTVFRS